MALDIEIFDLAPADFCSTLEVAACYLEFDNKLLMLQRADVKYEPGLWGMPAGKLEVGEDPAAAARRELFEETGIVIDHPSQIKLAGPLYIRKPDLDYIYHMFKVEFKQRPPVVISSEHCGYKWVTAEERQALPLMKGAE